MYKPLPRQLTIKDIKSGDELTVTIIFTHIPRQV